jgi:hypothetical protein
MSIEPKRIFLGVYEGGTRNVILPAAALKRADDRFDAEREARLNTAALAKLRIAQDARGKSRLRKALKLVFGSGR